MSKEKSSFIKWSARLANSSLSTVVGYIMRGVEGGVTALSATIADEFLISYKITAKHYLTSTALWTSIILPVAEFFPEYTLPLYVASVATAATIAYFGNDPLDSHNKMGEIVDHLGPVVKLFDDHDVISTKELTKLKHTFKSHPYEAIKMGAQDLWYLAHNKPLTTLSKISTLGAVDIWITNSFYSYISNNGTTMLALTLLSQNPEAKILELSYQGFKVAGLWFGKNIVSSVINFGKSYLQDNLKESIEQKTVKEILLNKDHLQKILGMDDTSEIMHNLVGYFNNLLFVGIMKFDSMTSGKTKEFMAFKNILALAPESIVLAQLIGFLNKKINDKMQQKYNKLAETSSKVNLDISHIVNDLSNNFIKAIFTGSTELIKEKYSNNIERQTGVSTKLKLYQNIQGSVSALLDVFEKLTEIVYYCHKITAGKLTIEQAPLLKTWLAEVAPLLQGGPTITWSQGDIAQKRVEKLLNAISSPYKDTITRSSNDDGSIIFNNYLLNIKDKQALKIDHLVLTQKHTAICGDSGLGKTSMLKDMQGCLVPPLSSSGEISLPKNATTMFIDQDLYIPATATLFEAITLKSVESFPDETTRENLKSRIIKLFKEFKIDQPAAEGRDDTGLIALLDDLSFKTDNLSGGQKKKIGIIKAIINKPDILVMDEIFVALDPKSLVKAQQLLNEYLPNTKMIIVDHTAQDHNYKDHNNLGFYDFCVKFSAKGWEEIKLTDIDAPEEINIAGEIGIAYQY